MRVLLTAVLVLGAAYIPVRPLSVGTADPMTPPLCDGGGQLLELDIRQQFWLYRC